MNINEVMKSAYELQNAGELDQAEYIYKELIKVQPNNVIAYYNLGTIFQDKAQIDQAIFYYKKALALDSNLVDSYFNLGAIFQSRGQIDDAINNYKKALELDPTCPEINNNLGTALKDKGRLTEAIAHYKKALHLNPHYDKAYNNLGIALVEKGQLDEAISHFKKAIEISPNFSEAYNNTGNALTEKGQLDEAMQAYRKAVQIEPNFTNAYIGIGNALKEKGRQDEAMVIYDKAILLSPHNFIARFARCVSQLPIIYKDQGSLQICRIRYHDELLNLRDKISFETPQHIKAAAEAVGSHQPFYLAYQGFNDRALQQIYGNLICKIMFSRYPKFAERPPMPQLLSDDQIRIGVVSGYFYLHSNWKIPIRGWVENLDKRRFSLYGYYTGRKKDDTTAIARQSFHRFIEDIYSLEELCQIIRNDNLHILIFPEIGMDPMTVKLASLRLAPVQCTSWGHPDTSGLPTLDYYLSSDLMEPHDADDHYTEQLIRLPHLSIFYSPVDMPTADATRDAFGLRQNSILYLCCQSLFKYLPQYDEIYPQIAREVGDCAFLFISYHKSDYVTEQFRLRIRKAFEQYGMSADDHVILLPRLDPVRYHALNHISDIFLDSIDWSGCNTTLEAIACNLPIVTFSGKLMRGRHSTAIFNMMGMKETIAESVNEYIEMAVRLGKNAEFTKHLSDKIAENKHLIYRDRTCITALEDFLEKAVRERLE